MTRLRYLVAAIGVMLMTVSLDANPLLPGGTVSPDLFTLTSVPSLLRDFTGSFDLGCGVTGSYEDAVLFDPLGVTCSGCLDFAYQLNLDSTSPDAIFTSSVTAFFGYTTNVGYVSGSGGVAPNSVTRGPFGGTVGFNFNTATVLGAGLASSVITTRGFTFRVR